MIQPERQKCNYCLFVCVYTRECKTNSVNRTQSIIHPDDG